MNSLFQILTLSWSLQGGQYINNVVDMNTIDSNSPYFLTTQFELIIPMSLVKDDENQFFLGGETETQFFKDGNGFSPWQETYSVSIGFRLMGIEGGYQHECIHPVVQSDSFRQSSYFAGYDKIHLKVTGHL